MNLKIKEIIAQLSTENISEERKNILQPLVEFIQNKISKNEDINLKESYENLRRFKRCKSILFLFPKTIIKDKKLKFQLMFTTFSLILQAKQFHHH